MESVKKTSANLLVEHNTDFIVESCEEVIVEGDNKDDKAKFSSFLKLKGTFQQGNTPNGNNRIYRTETLIRENERFQNKIALGTALGKAYHPTVLDFGGPTGVTDVSHRILRTWAEGDTIKGELLVLKTAIGVDIEAIIEGGGKIGISSRGYGVPEYYDEIEIAGKKFYKVNVIRDNYVLETYDLVLTPSVQAAMMMKMDVDKDKNKDKNESTNKKSDLTTENKKYSKGTIMTLDQLKSEHSELYNHVRAISFAEGKVESISKGEVKSEHAEAIKEQETNIKELKAVNEQSISEMALLKTENDALKTENGTLKTEKLNNEVSRTVEASVAKSKFKDYFKEEDLAYIKSIAASAEEATKEIASREAIYENAIEVYKKMSTVTTQSKSVDTSEENPNEIGEAKAFEDDQRSLAFG